MRLLPLVLSLFVVATMTVHAGPSTKSLTKRFDRLDLNGDAVVDAAEFSKLLPAKLSKNHALVETRAALFAWFDEDTSDGIDLGEWLEAMSDGSLGIPDFSDAIVDELDTNHDGDLTWKEFSRVMNSYGTSKTTWRWFKASRDGLSAKSFLSLTDDSPAISAPLPAGGPSEVSMATGGDCFAPLPLIKIFYGT